MPQVTHDRLPGVTFIADIEQTRLYEHRSQSTYETTVSADRSPTRSYRCPKCSVNLEERDRHPAPGTLERADRGRWASRNRASLWSDDTRAHQTDVEVNMTALVPCSNDPVVARGGALGSMR